MIPTTDAPSSKRSYFMEREAVDAAIAWCQEQDSAARPLAMVLNKDGRDPSVAVGDDGGETLSFAEYRVQHANDAGYLMLGTWAPTTEDEQMELARWAVQQSVNGDAGRRPVASPTWRRVEDIIGRPL